MARHTAAAAVLAVLSAALGWPTTVFYLPVIVGCLVMAIIMLVDLVAREASTNPGPPPGRRRMSLFLLFAVMPRAPPWA